MLALFGIFQNIDIHPCRKNCKYYKLSHPDFNDIMIGTYKQNMFPVFMLEDGVYINGSFNWVKT